MQRFDIILTGDARADLEEIEDQRTYQAIERKIDELATEPYKRGEALRGALNNYRKLKAANRFRIIYQVAVAEGVVTVVVVAIRKEGDKNDAYRIARKRLTGEA
ncbi:MAG: type II toxin-antitoxin system RelE/ParE family toxin [Trueperaceae bacterium]